MFEAEITELINKNLPAHVGEVLRKRLERCDALEREVAAKAHLIEVKDKEIAAFQRLVRSEENITRDHEVLQKRIAEQNKKEQQFAIDRAVLDAMKEANSQRIADHKEIVLAVFANAKYKYQQFESDTKTIVLPQSGGGSWDKTVTDHRSKRVETEGAGPTPQ